MQFVGIHFSSVSHEYLLFSVQATNWPTIENRTNEFLIGGNNIMYAYYYLHSICSSLKGRVLIYSLNKLKSRFLIKCGSRDKTISVNNFKRKLSNITKMWKNCIRCKLMFNWCLIVYWSLVDYEVFDILGNFHRVLLKFIIHGKRIASCPIRNVENYIKTKRTTT